ncbi:OmpA family protein [Photobacterium damselae]|uniref:OmpA family protein n=1 Tax=Photobacterium damselae TaxID=38293 RepID=UPI0015E69E25|nr:OmpA family protein [Photobacterium damselae]
MLKKTLLVSAILLSGCTTSIDQYPNIKQQYDLSDHDKDGVINQRDICKTTLNNSVITNEGCGQQINVGDVFKLHILFANDSVFITNKYNEEISLMANFMKQYPSTTVVINGYASKVGATTYNLGLSKRRSNVVRDLLIKNGIAPSRVTIEGFGETVPVLENGIEAEALSRRVTASLHGHTKEFLKQWQYLNKHN